MENDQIYLKNSVEEQFIKNKLPEIKKKKKKKKLNQMTLSDLSMDVFIYVIVEYLEPNEIGKLSMACKLFNSIFTSKIVRDRIYRYYGISKMHEIFFKIFRFSMLCEQTDNDLFSKMMIFLRVMKSSFWMSLTDEFSFCSTPVFREIKEFPVTKEKFGKHMLDYVFGENLQDRMNNMNKLEYLDYCVRCLSDHIKYYHYHNTSMDSNTEFIEKIRNTGRMQILLYSITKLQFINRWWFLDCIVNDEIEKEISHLLRNLHSDYIYCFRDMVINTKRIMKKIYVNLPKCLNNIGKEIFMKIFVYTGLFESILLLLSKEKKESEIQFLVDPSVRDMLIKKIDEVYCSSILTCGQSYYTNIMYKNK